MENEHPYRRNAFDTYKELRIYFINRTITVIDYNCKGTVMTLPFLWVKISSRGVIVKEKNSGKEIHFKYSSIDSAHEGALKCEDVELYTPFIKENDEVKFITWEEWNEKYDTEAICKRITSVTDERLKEHGTDLMFILDKLCACAGSQIFDYPHRFIKVEPRYQDNEYSLHRVVADFKWHHGGKQYDYIRYVFEYEAKNRTIHIDISKDETWYTPYPANSFGLLSTNIALANQVDAYSIDVEFNKDYSISKVTVKNKNKENLLKFMEMGNPVSKNTIRQIRDYINSKLVENQLTSHINTSKEEDMFVQTWSFSPRIDIAIEPSDVSSDKDQKISDYKAITRRLNEICDYPLLTSDWRTTWDHTYRDYDSQLNAFCVDKRHMEIRLNHMNNTGCVYPYYAKITVDFNHNGEIIALSYDDPTNVTQDNEFKEFNDLREFIENRTKVILRDPLAYVAEEFDKLFRAESFTLNKHGDMTEQIKREFESIYHTLSEANCGKILNGFAWTGFSPLIDHTKYVFKIEKLVTSHVVSISVLDGNIEKLNITLGFEGTELISIGLHPGFEAFKKKINDIYNPRVKRLVTELYNKLYKGEE